MTLERAAVCILFLAIAAYAIVGIAYPSRLVSHERKFEPFLPYWMRDLFIYDSERKVRRACLLFLAIAIAGLATLSVSR